MLYPHDQLIDGSFDCFKEASDFLTISMGVRGELDRLKGEELIHLQSLDVILSVAVRKFLASLALVRDRI